MTRWAVVPILLRLLLSRIAIMTIPRFRVTLNFIERVGLGIIGAGSFLTIGNIWKGPGPDNPFEGWTVALMTFGVVLLLLGRTYRDWRHERANIKMIEHAREWQHQRNSRI